MTLEELLRATLQDPTRRPSPDLEARIMSALPVRRGVGPVLRGSWVPLGAAAILAVVLVAGSWLPPRNGVVPLTTPRSPDASVDPTATPPRSAVPSASVATYPDGIPREIGGEPVLRGDAIAIEAAGRTDDRPFLIGGYAVIVLADCLVDPSAPTTPLLDPCGGGYHLRDSFSAGGIGVRFVVDGSLAGLLGGPVPQVLRVHVHDGRAAACAADLRLTCEHTLVVEASAWVGPIDDPIRIPEIAVGRDGIPVEIDDEAVLRGDAITAQIAAAADDESFLIGGWATGQIA